MVVKCGEGRKKTCNQCEGLKEENYMNDNFCKACRSAINKAKRVEKRLAEGKPPVGSGRNPNCSKCGELKDLQHRSSGYCRKCNSERMKKNTIVRREEQGLQPIGSGRKETCCRCDGLKENPKAGYCNSCHRQCDRQWRLATGRTIKSRTGLCQCGNEIASYSSCYCSDCASNWRREYLNNNPDVKERMYRRAVIKRAEDPNEQIKILARSIVNNHIRAGKLIKMACEVCQTVTNVEAHHDDYSKPLDVRWLCKKHHAEHHKNDTE